MISTFKNAIKIPDVRKKILWTLFFLLIYRVGCFIPVPGINVSAFQEMASQTNSIFGVMSAITGGALAQGTLFAIGISPYINASIIMQLLAVAIPALERMSKEENGKEKINKITRYVTLGLAIVQSLAVMFTFKAQSDQAIINQNLFGTGNIDEAWVFIFTTILFVAGSCACMWIGERITEKGISNGISLLIFIGIISTGGTTILNMIISIISVGFVAAEGWKLVVLLAVLVIIFAFVVFVDGGERKILVQYAKQVKGNKMYGGQSTYIPIKVNASGVLPLIFAFSILSLPQIIASTVNPNGGFAAFCSNFLSATGANSWLYSILLALLILAFAYVYSQITFKPDEVAKNMQQNGGLITGIRAGKPTEDYLTKVVRRITLYGAVFLAIMALVPSLIFGWIGGGSNQNNILLSAFGATGMLISVSVALEFHKSLEQQIMIRNYKGFMK